MDGRYDTKYSLRLTINLPDQSSLKQLHPSRRGDTGIPDITASVAKYSLLHLNRRTRLCLHLCKNFKLNLGDV